MLGKCRQMNQPKVSIITPTWNREAFLPAIHACVRMQNYENFEWLVLDDSDTPSTELYGCSWDNLQYIYSSKRMSTGEKRNILIGESTGEILINFDDDDYYGPDYIINRVNSLIESRKSISILSGFFVYHLNTGHFGYYRTRTKDGLGFQFHRNGVTAVELSKINIPHIHLCYGWSYVYTRDIWERVKFEDTSLFEDRAFVQKAMQFSDIDFYESHSIDAIHAIHNLSSSNCFPQFLIPEFMMSTNSNLPIEHIGQLREVVNKINAGMPTPAA